MIKNRLQQIWQRFSFRERILVSIVFFVLAPIIIIRFVLWPIISFNDSVYSDYQDLRVRVQNFEHSLAALRELQRNNSSNGFNFMEASKNIFAISGIVEKPEIRENKSEIFGATYVIRFNSLRNDQIFKLIYNLENNTPPLVIEKIETQESIQSTKLASVVLVVKSE